MAKSIICIQCYQSGAIIKDLEVDKMSAREIARMVVEALESERETYLELLQNEDYKEIEDELCEYLAAE